MRKLEKYYEFLLKCAGSKGDSGPWGGVVETLVFVFNVESSSSSLTASQPCLFLNGRPTNS